jgi:hypothetical protein
MGCRRDREERDVRYMLLFYLTERAEPGTPEGNRFFEERLAYHRWATERGVLVSGLPLHEPSSATSVRVRDGETLLVDGPFAESAEWLGGYFIVDCKDLDEAVQVAARCPTAAQGTLEVRPVMATG